jgi:MOSC domain-containing protein YiiM
VESEAELRVLSVNVGAARKVAWKGRMVSTGIFKEPVAQRVGLRRLNLDGDQQADLSVHGGAEKAVYAYPAEHYGFWAAEFPDMQLPWGMFGENLTTLGLDEQSVKIGDRLRIGSAELIVTQPRMPCYKLGLRFGRDDIVKRFLQSQRSGFYLAVLREGEVGAGDAIAWIERDPQQLSVTDIVRLYVTEKTNVALLQRAIALEALPENWRAFFRERLEALG